MLPQENLKFSALKVPFSCVLRAPQAIQTQTVPPPERHNSVQIFITLFDYTR